MELGTKDITPKGYPTKMFRKCVLIPEKGQAIFKELSKQYSSDMLWLWAVYSDPFLSKCMEREITNLNPPKAIRGEVEGYFYSHGDQIAIEMVWREPKK